MHRFGVAPGVGADCVLMQTGENPHQIRIAPSASGLFLHYRQRGFRRESLLVGTGAGESIVYIRELQDARQQGNLFSLEAVRIAGAVPSLVMMTDDRQD